MVYQWTNFVWETNAWWLRRVRPFIFGGIFGFVSFFSYRYYFFGKWMFYKQRQYSEDELIAQAQLNKRDWGFGAYYKPTLQRSRKLQIMQALGDKYQYATLWEDRYLEDPRNLEEILEEENSWEEYDV